MFKETAAVAQWVRALAPQAESWMSQELFNDRCGVNGVFKYFAFFSLAFIIHVVRFSVSTSTSTLFILSDQ